MRSTPPLPKTLTASDFQAIADFCFRTIQQRLPNIPDDEALDPVVLLGVINEGKIELTACFDPPPQLDLHRAVLPVLMDTMLRDEGTAGDFAVFITEAWMLPYAAHPDLTQSIADHPQRQEAVVFNILSKDCQVFAVNPLHRNPRRLERGELITKILGGRMVRPKPPAH